jgi:hypothetical protein
MTDIMSCRSTCQRFAPRSSPLVFDGGQLSSDGGLLLLRAAERRLGIAGRLVAMLRDPRDSMRISHGLAQLLKTRVFAICSGNEDGNDLDQLRHDPLVKAAAGRPTH